MQNYVCLRCLLRRSTTTKRSTNIDPSALGNRRTLSSQTDVQLDSSQLSKIGRLHGLRQKLESGLRDIPEAKSDYGVPFEKLIAAIKSSVPETEQPLVQTLEQVYGGKTHTEVNNDLEKIAKHRRPSANTVHDDATIKILDKLGIISQSKTDTSKPVKSKAKAESKAEDAAAAKSPRKRRARATLASRKIPSTKTKLTKEKTPKIAVRRVVDKKAKPTTAGSKRSVPAPVTVAKPAPADTKSIEASSIAQLALETEHTPEVPRLSFDLSRALFNPGVYQLRDPRSRVYNFDPYLENIMPVHQFNFDALNAYITSSEDQHLRNVALKHKKRYIGSSSSMSGAMSHFHFLLSAWRPLDTSHLSQKIDGLKSFTIITRAPSSIYLRWRNGVYAIDADKEHDTPNILMMQGKSMEKLLTMEKDEFEKYRRPQAGQEAPAIGTEPEAYHYTGMENFLLRSQLDAHDPRLPGSGMFDLKTRAVAGIRMDMRNYEHGMGYQIKDRFGAWESYEREYFDMVRSAFLKYSLQVRMGRMDGIFVAYHNIARIFGFQYVPLPELDACLHGQTDRALGDREFRITIKLMNEIFDQATKIFPQQSLRFIFETREATKTEPSGYMQIFAEAMTEDEIGKIQKAGKDRVADYERQKSNSSLEGNDTAAEVPKAAQSPSTLESNAADTAFLDEVLGETTAKKTDVGVPQETKSESVAGWRLRIFNEVNGRSVPRPERLTADDRWVVRYKLERRGDEEAKKLYTACKARRAAALVFDEESKTNNMFIERIRRLSEEGKIWRAEQDALDAQREHVVLYSPQPGTPDSEAAQNS
ncbi:hypothetical protein H2198_000782 [Neophaeococcomyces mojaviensis]|uniref:Uncharacterized protein n=1 Tax=Neophaeococcomyces mojaviensis TaxID=3383035 RepID=A0ACC3AIX8_9EURO|nr:hypothetical protein H2198_000782 [Knufia sp. JES_112]